jgi:hypothetical protein
MSNARILLLIVTVCLVTAIPASAATIYTNGPGNGTVNAWIINTGYKVTDSFTLSQADTISGATFGAWLIPSDTLLSVDWLITTGAFSGTLASGTSAAVNTYMFNVMGFDVYSESISILPNLSLAAGTYWFQLQNAVASVSGDPVFWDENDGPSQAFQKSPGTQQGSIPSESFTIENPIPVPEPGTMALFGCGVLFFGLLHRKTH